MSVFIKLFDLMLNKISSWNRSSLCNRTEGMMPILGRRWIGGWRICGRNWSGFRRKTQPSGGGESGWRRSDKLSNETIRSSALLCRICRSVWRRGAVLPHRLVCLLDPEAAETVTSWMVRWNYLYMKSSKRGTKNWWSSDMLTTN